MSDRSNMIVGLLAVAATLIVLPASVTLVYSSLNARRAIAVLRAPSTFEIRGTDILNPRMYDTKTGSPRAAGATLHLVSVATSQAEALAALGVWDSVKAESSLTRADIKVVLTAIGEEFAFDSVPAHVVINRVKNPVEFSTRTGIRVFPFTLVIAGEDHVLAAGPGLPDASFIRDAAERFMRDGRNAATAFRRVTPEINSSLRSIEMLFSSNATAR